MCLITSNGASNAGYLVSEAYPKRQYVVAVTIPFASRVAVRRVVHYMANMARSKHPHLAIYPSLPLWERIQHTAILRRKPASEYCRNVLVEWLKSKVTPEGGESPSRQGTERHDIRVALAPTVSRDFRIAAAAIGVHAGTLAVQVLGMMVPLAEEVGAELMGECVIARVDLP